MPGRQPFILERRERQLRRLFGRRLGRSRLGRLGGQPRDFGAEPGEISVVLRVR
jgi:hypothetical protein